MIYLDPPHPNIDLCCKICVIFRTNWCHSNKDQPHKNLSSPWSPDVLFKNSISFSAPKCWAWRFWKRSSSNFNKTTLPETNSSHLKMDGWKMSFFLGLKVYFQGRTVSFREGNNPQKLMSFPSLESFSKSEFSGSKCYFLWGKGCMFTWKITNNILRFQSKRLLKKLKLLLKKSCTSWYAKYPAIYTI